MNTKNPYPPKKHISPDNEEYKRIGVRLGNPYLNSGESIIQTTDRITVNSVSSDLLLTTRRLILVDSSYTRFEPIQIPFATIMSLRGGWNTDGDPVITLTLTDPGDPDSTYTLDLVFSQLTGEHRKEECDGWVEYLMDQIVLARQETIRTDTVSVDLETGIQPSTRRWVAPERIQPHTTIRVPRPVPSGESITPIRPDSPPVTGDNAESTVSSALPENEGKEVPEIIPEEIQLHDSVLPALPAIEESTDAEKRGTGLPDPGYSATSDVTDSPAHKEGTAGLHKREISPDIQSQEPSGSPEHEDMLQIMTEENTELPEPEVRKSSEVPETIPGSPEARNPCDEDSRDVSAVSKERQESRGPEILHELEGVRSEIPFTQEMGSPDDVLPAEPEIRDTPPVPEAELPVQSAQASHVPEGIVWPIIHTNEPTSPDTHLPRENNVVGCEGIRAETAIPEIPASPPPSPSPGPGWHMIIIAIAICALILAIAGGALFYSQYLAGNHEVSQTPEIIPAPAMSQTPTIPVVIIPKTGIWVRVDCNSTFLGSVGNPGSLKMVSGSGNQLYQIRQSDSAVQASFQKQDYNGDSMTVEVYNNGKKIAHRIITAPKGSIDFIIDPKTGEPFGIPLNRT